MFEVIVTVNGIAFLSFIPNERFGTVDLSKAKEIGRYNNKGKSGSVISDGENCALNPDLCVMRGTRVVEILSANELPTEGFWGIIDKAWDLVDAAPTQTEPDAPEDTF
tara:strand:- start:1270 stop:1593 length:324 start_codon:yes stop_codon:yes gene_type:complete